MGETMALRTGARDGPERREVVGPFGRKAIPLGRLFGIELGLDWSWLFIFLLITLSVSGRFAAEHEDWSALSVWGGALLASLLFFASILLHELGHSVTSQMLGLPVRSITLFLFGGLARLSGEPSRPRDLFLIGAAGPAVSVTLGMLFLAVSLLVPGSPSWAGVVGAVCSWLGLVNLVLAGFNLFPGYPLDGGQLLRATIWGITGSLEKATRVSATMGGVFASFLIGMGILAGLVGGDWLGGLWLVFIGWFLMTAAKASTTQVVLEKGLGAIRAEEVMNVSPPGLPAAETVAAAIEGPILHGGHRYLIALRDAQPVGLVTLHEVKRVPAAARGTTPLTEVMVPAEQMITIEPGTSLWEVLRTMDRENVNQVPVVQDGRLLGVVSREQLLRVVRNQMELGMELGN
jgi:Zn-dependent protease/CBS domain-containing protein